MSAPKLMRVPRAASARAVRSLALLDVTGARTACRRRRARRWRAVWSLWGPLLPIALGMGMLAGAALALLRGRPT